MPETKPTQEDVERDFHATVTDVVHYVEAMRAHCPNIADLLANAKAALENDAVLRFQLSVATAPPPKGR